MLITPRSWVQTSHGPWRSVWTAILAALNLFSYGSWTHMVERPLNMGKVPGSMPGFSKDKKNLATRVNIFVLSFLFASLFSLFAYCYSFLRGWCAMTSCTLKVTVLKSLYYSWQHAWKKKAWQEVQHPLSNQKQHAGLIPGFSKNASFLSFSWKQRQKFPDIY